MPYPVLQSMFDPLLPPGLQWYWKAHFLKEIPDASLSVHRRFGEQMPTPLTTMHLYPINGAAGRVGKDDTAWPNRDAVWAQVIVGIDPDPANKDALIQWARSYWDEMEPFSMAGAYVNFLMGDEGEQRVRATYGESYDRLASIKAKYDPTNFFRVNQNINPKQ